MNDYGMYLSFNNQQEGFYLPVLPEKLEIQKKGKGKSFEIVGLGEINVIQNLELASISIESFFPVEPFPHTVPEPKADPEKKTEPVMPKLLAEPQWYVDKIDKWMASGRPIRFIFTGSKFSVNLPMSIEQFDRWESAGTVGEIGFRLSLKEYVFYAAKKVLVVQQGGKPVLRVEKAARPDERPGPKTYTLKAGDTLIKVAKKQFGNDARWKEIQKLNGITDAQVKKLPVGKVLKLPER
jgi:nucleoid-associated protein YgaU